MHFGLREVISKVCHADQKSAEGYDGAVEEPTLRHIFNSNIENARLVDVKSTQTKVDLHWIVFDIVDRSSPEWIKSFSNNQSERFRRIDRH